MIKIVEIYYLLLNFRQVQYLPGMQSADYQTTVLLQFFIIIVHNFVNVWTINQSKSLPGFQVVDSLDGINGRSSEMLLRE